MKINFFLFAMTSLLVISCSKECIETENFYEVPIKCTIDRILNRPDVKVLKLLNEERQEIESFALDNTFKVMPWNTTKVNKKINYDTTFYVQVQKQDLSIELDSINFLYNVETDDCGTFVIKQMRFQYNARTNFTGTFNNNVCSFTFLKE